MKTLSILAILALLLTHPVDTQAGDKKNTCSNSFKISGMKCAGCAAGLEFELGEIKAIKSTKIDFDKKLATIIYNTNRLSTVELVKTIKKLGYEAKLEPKKAPEPKGK